MGNPSLALHLEASQGILLRVGLVDYVTQGLGGFHLEPSQKITGFRAGLLPLLRVLGVHFGFEIFRLRKFDNRK